MNKRLSPRFPVTVAATVTLPDGAAQSCTIRDYCSGGMYLLCKSRSPHVPASIQGQTVQVAFSDPQRIDLATILIEARVARVEPHGLGLAFAQESRAAVIALSQLAASQAAGGQEARALATATYGEATVNEVVAQCRRKADAHIAMLLESFMHRVSDALFEAVNSASSNAQRTTFQGAANALRQAGALLAEGYRRTLQEQLALLSEPGYRSRFVQGGNAERGLSLVESSELESWLLVRSMASRLEESLSETLEALETRLEAISVNPVSIETNPLGPFVLASIFSEELDRLALEEEARRVLFDSMAQVMAEGLRRLYDELNEMLIAHGVLPTLARKLELVRGSGRGGSLPRQNVGTGTTVAPTPVRADTQTLRYTRTARQEGDLAQGPAVTNAPFQGVCELIRLREPSADETGEVGTFSSEQVLQAIGQFAGQLSQPDEDETDALAHVRRLSGLLGQASGESARVLSESNREAVAYLGGLFHSIQRDPHLAVLARPWYSRLETPLLQAGILDPSLLEDESHPARQLLNLLEQIADRLEGDRSETARRIVQQVERILGVIQGGVTRDAEVFVDALEQLEHVRRRVMATYEQNLQRLVAECEQEKRLDRVRKQVLGALNQRLCDRDVPQVVLTLLDMGWKKLLWRTLLKDGEQSRAYTTYLEVIDQLNARLTGAAPFEAAAPMSNDQLLEWVSRMLAVISDDEADNAVLFAEIAGYLDGSADRPPVLRHVTKIAIRTPPHYQAIGRPDDLTEADWRQMQEDTDRIPVGTLFRHLSDGGGARLLTLIWKDAAEQHYVFADGAGCKALELHGTRLTASLHRRQLAPVDEKIVPLTERATFNFMQNLHNQLAFQASHDQLTGLLSRKAFEEALVQAHAETVGGGASHVLAYMDLDRFTVINTACGHVEGDRLLGKVAQLLRDTLPAEVVMARLGGDEFGLLFRHYPRDNGLMLITRVHDNLRAMHFSCQENRFKVTASIGVGEIDAESDSAGKLLSLVDNAAFTAKENGRDNIQIYTPSNTRINARRMILDWVGRINVLFEKDLINLRCQKIAPLDDAANALPHYEVLLDVRDEQGNPVPVEEFILAAERYNRIIDIDTWVVNKVFDWLERHHEKMTRIANLSVNLSGVSISNRPFMERLHQRMRATGFPAKKVCFEVTESIAINNIDHARRFMNRLKETGCHFSLDDFGKGHSSYAYLRSLPIDYVKIDGAFVRDIASSPSDYAVVKSINEIAHVMGKQTIAEYVVDDPVLQAVRAIGLDFVQGFAVEKPIPLHALLGRLGT